MQKNGLMALSPTTEFRLLADYSEAINTHVDPDKLINIGVNQRFNIALDSDPTTGYDWEESYDNNALNLVDDKYEEDEKAEGLVGNGGTQYFQFKALKTGKTKIFLVYKQLWGQNISEKKVFIANIG